MRKRLLTTAKGFVEVFCPALVGRVQARREALSRRKIEAILARPGRPATARAEGDFDKLQASHKGIPNDNYYSNSNKWRRAVERCRVLADLLPEATSNATALELGCGDGMTGFILSTTGAQVVISDLEDWRDERAKPLRFIQAQLEQGLPLPDQSYDLVYSFEAFEHFPDPAKCFQEIERLCRPGGTVHLNFGPLFASAWGLHAYNAIKVPYAQFLFSEEFITAKIKQLGNFDLGRRMDVLQPLNRWRLDDFLRLWRHDQWRTRGLRLWGPANLLKVVREYPEAFCGRGLGYRDLVTQAIVVTLQRARE